MTEQTKPVAAEQGTTLAPAQEAVSDATTLQALLRLLLADREEQLLEKKAKLAAWNERNRQRILNAEFNEAEKLSAQAMCTHKKGGRSGPKSPKVDYAISFHTFVDASSYIRCLICGMKWKNTDTTEYLVRRGKQVKNHTGIGWKEAYKMLGESTNTPTSSEVMLNTRPVVQAPTDFEKDPRAVEI